MQQFLQEVRRQAVVQALREVVVLRLQKEVALVAVLLQEAAVLQEALEVLEVVEDRE